MCVCVLELVQWEWAFMLGTWDLLGALLFGFLGNMEREREMNEVAFWGGKGVVGSIARLCVTI